MVIRVGSKLGIAVAAVVVMTLSVRSLGGDLPRPTKEGVEALSKLIDRCVRGGGLRLVKASDSDAKYLEIADPAKLGEVILAGRATITRPLIDALVGGWEDYDEREEPFAIGLLGAIGTATGDARAAGFGALFAAQVAARRRGAEGAVALFDEAAARFARAGDRAWQATALHEAGLTQRKLGDYGGAIDHYRRALDIRLKDRGEDDPLVATTLNNLGAAYEAAGDLRRAEEFQGRALAIREKTLPPDDPALAWSYRNLSNLAFKSGRLDEATDLLSKALTIRRANAAKEPGPLADALGALGVLRSERGELLEAGALFEEALELHRRLGPEGELEQAVVLGNMGVAAERGGDYSRALDLYRRSLEIRRRRLPSRHPEIAHSLGLLSKLHGDMGQYPAAIDLGQQALAIRRQYFGPEHPEVARSLNNLGGIYKNQGDDPRALGHYREALAIWKAAYADPHPDIGYCLDNIAGVLSRRGDWAGALTAHREAMRTLEATLGPRHPEVAASLLGLASTSKAAGRHAEAMASYLRAIEISRGAGPAGRAGLVASLNDLGSARARQGDLAGAERDLREALDLARKALGANHPSVARTLIGLASVRESSGNPAEAGRMIDEAIESLGGRAGAGLPDTELSLELLARRGRLLEATLGEAPGVPRLQACAEAYEEAAARLDRLRGSIIASREGKLQIGGEAAEVFPRLVGIRGRLAGAEKGREAAELKSGFVAAERGMARVFLESLGRSRADRLGGVDPILLGRRSPLQARLMQVGRRLEDERGRPVERRRPEAIGLLEEQRGRLEQELRGLDETMEADYPRFAALKSPRPCTAEEAREELAEDEVALIYVPGSTASYLITLSKSGTPETGGLAFFALPPSDAIAELAAVLTSPKVLGDVESSRARGAEAYRMLLAPAAETIRGKGLVIVPGGVLASLPFELLVESPDGGEDGRPLVEGHRIRYAPSLTALRMVGPWERARTRPERPFWAVGDPIYDRSDSRLGAGEQQRGLADREPGTDLGFGRLPATGVEVTRLAELMGAGPGEVLSGREASEAAVKRLSGQGSLSKYRFVHFATHGVLEAGRTGQPGLVLSLVGDLGGEDGYLSMDEVTGLRLDADLVVLSACQTGQGEIDQAEGISGLARAFLYAGSRGVLCSLWQVDDAATADLMADLYANLKAGQPSADALRSAQRKMIGAGEPPLHWAPFILIGR